jgi:hypothetical protein
MVPALPETPPADTEFDLDVRLEAVARGDRAEKPGPEGTVTPMSCENTACHCP